MGVAAVVGGVAAKVSTVDGVGRLSSELLALYCGATFRCPPHGEPWQLNDRTLKSYAGKLFQFAEFCHNSKNISPLKATPTSTLVWSVAWIGAPLSHIRYQGGWATNSDVVLDCVDPNVLPSHGAWFFFGHFQVQQDSAAVAF
eukprot:jgi/Tetstr1/433015/TSEL_022352.t1